MKNLSELLGDIPVKEIGDAAFELYTKTDDVGVQRFAKELVDLCIKAKKLLSMSELGGKYEARKD